MYNNNLIDLLCCPICHSKLIFNQNSAICDKCGQHFPSKDDFTSFICKQMYASDKDYEHALEVIEYWGNGWEKRLKENEHNFLLHNGKEHLIEEIDHLISVSNSRNGSGDLWSNEMITDFPKMNNKTCLNIGCGAASEAITLVYKGNCNCIAMDMTSQAAGTTSKAIKKLGGVGIGIQADARFIPLSDSSVDLVYSSGVLHHSEDINQSIHEIYRVLKPGGIAYIGLYAKASVKFFKIQMKSIFHGKFNINRRKEYLSNMTEGAWRTDDRLNPYTRLFETHECKKLFKNFNNTNIRKGNFSFSDIPILGKLFNRYSENILLKKLENSHFLSALGSGVYIRAEK